MDFDICVKQKYAKGTKDLLDHTPHRIAKELDAYVRASHRKPLVSNPLLINWGRTEIVGLDKYSHILNKPGSVSLASNKTSSLKQLHDCGINTLQYMTTPEEAEQYMRHNPESWIVCRKLTRSSGGKGIVLAKTKEELVSAPLYTVYFKKNTEFRYHVFRGQIIDVQQKRRLTSDELTKRGFKERPPSYIRNLENGYIFARENIRNYSEIHNSVLRAINCHGLDFGAVDVLANIDSDTEDYRSSVICEINTAPGLTGTTFTRYVESISNYYHELY